MMDFPIALRKDMQTEDNICPSEIKNDLLVSDLFWYLSEFMNAFLSFLGNIFLYLYYNWA